MRSLGWGDQVCFAPLFWSVVITQWENECISLSVLTVTWVQFPDMAEYSKGYFPGWSLSATLADHTLPTRPKPAWQNMAEHGSISSQWHHTTCGHRGGRPTSNHGHTMAEFKENNIFYSHPIVTELISKVLCVIFRLFSVTVSYSPHESRSHLSYK